MNFQYDIEVKTKLWDTSVSPIDYKKKFKVAKTYSLPSNTIECDETRQLHKNIVSNNKQPLAYICLFRSDLFRLINRLIPLTNEYTNSEEYFSAAAQYMKKLKTTSISLLKLNK